ncbi:MAG TPA: dUTP diphosphatase [Maribacter sp.]|nr:dUTP diphosphatase [Maribacter sp.]
MKVKIKRLHEDAVIPKYAKPGDAGMDITAISFKRDKDILSYDTGIAIEIPNGYVGLIYPRSSVYKTGLRLCNSVGVIDSGYRGEIKFKFQASKRAVPYKVGDRIGQLIIVPFPQIEFEEVHELSSTERGEGGYGSTGS